MNKKSNSFDRQSFLKTLTSDPGVYQMLGREKQVLYVGKAKHLKNRVSSYFQKNLTPKTQALMRQVVDVQVIVVRSENEALILENNLIKKHKPRYNILFRDDKSYPYIYANTEHQFPRLDLYRGAKKKKGKYFGPFPGVGAVRDTLNLFQKIFLLRTCRDSFFKNRSRPCLQYQIKRCSGPCVGLIDQKDYQRDAQSAIDFLSGKDERVLKGLQERMEEASKKQAYELAAKYRDQIASLREVQAEQFAEHGERNIDVLVLAKSAGQICIGFLVIRHGRILGNKTFIQTLSLELTDVEVMQSFISQYYLQDNIDWPSCIVTDYRLPNKTLLESVMGKQKGAKVVLQKGGQHVVSRWLKIALSTAKQRLHSLALSKSKLEQQFQALRELLKQEELFTRIECFDVSHHSGEATVASCVVFNQDGPLKSDYRRFNIKGVQASDDYAAMYQALLRRFTKLKTDEAKLPDLLLIDGGKGQLKQAEKVLEELQISGVLILAIAKGVTRKPGFESLWLSGKKLPLECPPDSLALHLLQQVRDQAHRFAITANRERVGKKRNTSVLEGIEGVGVKRRQQLLKHFGGLQGISKASIDELQKVSGVSKALAEKIYTALR